jgi:Putative binding domain, N-terminal/Viral BACON domain
LLSSHSAVATVESVADLDRAKTRLLVAVVLSLASAIVAAGCETSSTVSTGPNPVKCQVSVAAPGMLEAVGGSSSITVTALPECAWTASTSASWIAGLSPTSGQGNGSVSFRAAANDGLSVREGTILVNDEQARVSQRAPCRYTLSPATQTIATSGGASTVTVTTTEADCAWTGATDAEWISLTAPTSGTGAGVITFTVPPNLGGQRTGAIIVAGQRATVIQSAAAPPNCNTTISPTGQNVPAAGGSGSISVQSQSTCDWAVASDAPWITVTSGPTGRGNGVVAFSVAANTGAARTGTISIANRTFTVSQAAGAAPPSPPPACTYAIAPTAQNVPSTASTGTVNVTTTAACAWTALSNAVWLTVTSGAAGTGNGVVGFSVAANTGAARTGMLTIATQTFSVTQAAGAPPCSYSISPTSQNVDANANTSTVAVTTTTGCAWTAASGAPWLTVTSGASGTGSGSVGVSIAANTGAARSGTVTIAGETFTVNQAAFVAPCTYSIAPTTQAMPALGGAGTVTVTTTSACAWTASSNAPWLTITSGAAGTGNGTVGFSAAVNVLGSRTGTLTIAGQTFSVTQDGVVGPLSR